MHKVKSVWYLTKDQVKDVQTKMSDPYIVEGPVFQLDDDSVIYTKHGSPAGGEIWFDAAKPV